jgi:hypothetical protein
MRDFEKDIKDLMIESFEKAFSKMDWRIQYTELQEIRYHVYIQIKKVVDAILIIINK